MSERLNSGRRTTLAPNSARRTSSNNDNFDFEEELDFPTAGYSRTNSSRFAGGGGAAGDVVSSLVTSEGPSGDLHRVGSGSSGVILDAFAGPADGGDGLGFSFGTRRAQPNSSAPLTFMRRATVFSSGGGASNTELNGPPTAIDTSLPISAQSFDAQGGAQSLTLHAGNGGVRRHSRIKSLDQTTRSSSDNNGDSIDEEGGILDLDNDKNDETNKDGNNNQQQQTSQRSSSSSENTSGLPCGMSMTVVMVVLIFLPIGFLVGFTSVPLNAAISGQSYISEERTTITKLLAIIGRLQDESGDGSDYLFEAPGSGDEINAHTILLLLRSYSDLEWASVLTAASRMKNGADFERRVASLRADLTSLRTLADAKTITGPEYRNKLLQLIERANSLIITIAEDPRVQNLGKKILVYWAMRRLQNSLVGMGITGRFILRRDGYDTENIRDMKNLKESIERDLITIEATGDTNVYNEISKWKSSFERITFYNLVDVIITGTPLVWATISFNTWDVAATNAANNMNSQDSLLLDQIVKDYESDALVAGLKMMGAVVACILATVFVIMLQRKEHHKMERMLHVTRKMAHAVQRFVPRNQLKTMGVRSITQVTPGLQVEVAQTILFSDIRDFTGLSEQMKNLELFDWLQSYVSRMTKVTSEAKGYIDQFIGDAVFCVFPQPTNGLRAAIQMHVSTDALNLELAAKETRTVMIGVGVHYGVVVAGVFGDSTRLSCTMVASDVNLASRLEALTKSFGAKIIASEAVIGHVDTTAYDMRPLGKVQVAGSTQAISIYDVFQNDAVAMKTYKHETLEDFERAVELADNDPEEAAAIFKRLAKRAREAGLIDVAAEKKADTTIASPHGSVLEFEKNGEIRSPSNNSGAVRRGSASGGSLGRSGGRPPPAFTMHLNDSLMNGSLLSTQ